MKKNFIVAALIAINAARVVAAEPVDVQPVEGRSVSGYPRRYARDGVMKTLPESTEATN